MSQLKFVSDVQARTKGIEDGEGLMRSNKLNVNRQRLAQSESALAQEALKKAEEFEEAGASDQARQQRFQAAYHQAKADRLASLTYTDLGGSKMNQRRKIPFGDWLATRGQLVLPFLTMVGVLVLGSTAGAPLWLTLIGAGAAARIVAMRRRAGPWACRIWGILPAVPMLLGWTWIFWAAIVVHVLLWPHPTEQRPEGGQNGQGGQQPPRRI